MVSLIFGFGLEKTEVQLLETNNWWEGKEYVDTEAATYIYES